MRSYDQLIREVRKPREIKIDISKVICSGNSAQSDHFIPLQTDHLFPGQIDHLIPGQIDHYFSASN